MARIQTPLYLTIGKFAPMTLSVSVAVMSSFSTLLFQLKVNKYPD
nr:unnamed protein product [Callosobruchus chinensis]